MYESLLYRGSGKRNIHGSIMVMFNFKLDSNNC